MNHFKKITVKSTPHFSAFFYLTIQLYSGIKFYRNDAGHCPFEKFIDGLPEEDAYEIVASIAALRELGNKARRPLVDYLENGVL